MRKIEELEEYIQNEEIRFIRLAFFDIFGEQRNIAIMPQELRRAVEEGIAIDAAAIPGFSEDIRSDLFLEPDPDTRTLIPWRSLDGGVMRMFCDITRPDRKPFEKDSRYLLKRAIQKAAEEGISVDFGVEVEFYIFKQDENGQATQIPHDEAGYFAVSPKDKGENIRRDICQMLMEMGITPESSHHEQGPGQHEVVFRYGNPLQTADNTATLKWVVENVVMLEGCRADFSPKPLREKPGNGMHLNLSVTDKNGNDAMDSFMAGVMEHIREITLFLNPVPSSYERLGTMEAPGYISWSEQNRSQLIRVPAVRSGKRRFELRSPDPMANPHLAYTLLIYAGLDGVKRKLALPPAVDANLSAASPELRNTLARLPGHFEEAVQCAKASEFVRQILPEGYIEAYCEAKHK